MDVVRENIEAIGGSISLSSTLGQGTCFSIKIPLTLAIAPALIVQAGNHRFCSAAGECRRSRRTGARCRA
jgi:two-component system chemotaxis sensor kinase CheA